MGSSDFRRSKGLSAGLPPPLPALLLPPAFTPLLADAGPAVRPEDKEEEAPPEGVVVEAGDGVDMILPWSAGGDESVAVISAAPVLVADLAAKLSELSEVSMLMEDAAIISMVSLSTQDLISAESLSMSGLFLAR